MSSHISSTCPSGQLTGVQNADGSVEYLGIRFATAERFRAPVDIEMWDGQYDATRYGSISPQVPGMLENILGFSPSDMNEDCLFLNVFASETPDASSKRPVLVWIHGGAYTNGSGSTAWYHGGTLSRPRVGIATAKRTLDASHVAFHKLSKGLLL